MEKSFAKSNIALRRITDPSKYQPQIDPADMDADIYNDVSKNRNTFYAIFADDDNTVGLCCIRDDADAFLYIYIFTHYFYLPLLRFPTLHSLVARCTCRPRRQ